MGGGFGTTISVEDAAVRARQFEPYVEPGSFFVNIGACDGVANDPIYPLLERFALRGIAVEPVPHVFQRLRENLGGVPGVVLENVAIAGQAGARSVFHLPPSAEGNHDWVQQIASLDNSRVSQAIYELSAWGAGGIPGNLEPLMIATEVECLTFDDLMRRHAVERVDFLSVDTEGLDFEIVQSIDFERWRPRVICVESKMIPQRDELVSLLARHGYAHAFNWDYFTDVFVLSGDVRLEAPAAPDSPPLEASSQGPERVIDGRAFVVSPNDATYRYMIRAEGWFWNTQQLDREVLDSLLPGPVREWINRCLTGNGAVEWLDELAARGPFPRAAVLGSTGGYHETAWLGKDSSSTLDVYDVSGGVLERTRQRADRAGLAARLVTHEVDLNLAELPVDTYDLVWADGCLGHLPELDAVLAKVERSLTRGGLFALHEYVGEPRMRYSADRLRAMNALLDLVPERFRRRGSARMEAPPLFHISPFDAASSDRVLAAAEARFDVIFRSRFGSVIPALFFVDLQALERERPDLLATLVQAAADAETALPGCLAYAVLRPRRGVAR